MADGNFAVVWKPLINSLVKNKGFNRQITFASARSAERIGRWITMPGIGCVGDIDLALRKLQSAI